MLDAQEFQGRDFAESFVARDANGNTQDLRDHNGQGTAVASLIGGNNVGVAKGANIIPVKHLLSDKTLGSLAVAKSSPMSLFASLQWILWHVIKSGKQGRAVVNVSQGKSRTPWALRYLFAIYGSNVQQF